MPSLDLSQLQWEAIMEALAANSQRFLADAIEASLNRESNDRALNVEGVCPGCGMVHTESYGCNVNDRPGGSSPEQMRSQVVPSPARGAPQDHPDHGRDPAFDSTDRDVCCSEGCDRAITPGDEVCPEHLAEFRRELTKAIASRDWPTKPRDTSERAEDSVPPYVCRDCGKTSDEVPIMWADVNDPFLCPECYWRRRESNERNGDNDEQG